MRTALFSQRPPVFDCALSAGLYNLPMQNGAVISEVEPGSPADDAGFTPGCRITHVDGEVLRDVIDWRWRADGGEVELSYIDTDGDAGTIVLEREVGEGWGISFESVVFDGIRQCKNACKFCFERQLPAHMRSSLSMRDDDFRLSFLSGTFITLTNLLDADIERIIEQHISPLRVSLHAVDPVVRRTLMGKNAHKGIENLERLLEAGIEFDGQVVLVPDMNDGDVLDETLAWAYERPGILNVGIVPLGFTRHQTDFVKSFDAPPDAERLIEQIKPFQRRALAERGTPWVFAADEFYRNAYGADVLSMLPGEEFYGDFGMFEDGIGIIRSAVDDFRAAVSAGEADHAARALDERGVSAAYICGEAMMPYIGIVVEESPLAGRLTPMPVKNGFFGGNVNVTGLLCGVDVAKGITADAASRCAGAPRRSASSVNLAAHPTRRLYLVPKIIFNADGVTLDDWTLDEIKAHVPADVAPWVFAVAVNPINYMQDIVEIVRYRIPT